MKSERITTMEQYIFEKETVTIEELCNTFSLSTNTVRRYLTELGEKGRIRKIYGGAMIVHLNEIAPEPQRAILEISAKTTIGRLAASLIQDGDTIFLDSGSTVPMIVKFLDKTKHVTIITNSVPVITQGANMPNIDLICLGGQYYSNTNSFYSDDVLKSGQNMNFNKLFLGCAGITIESGITNTTYYETALKHVVMKNSEKIILLADRTKIGKNALRSLCKLNELYAFVTDVRPSDAIINYCQQHDISLLYDE